MTKDIRDKETELRKKWSYLKKLSKDDSVKKERHTNYMRQRMNCLKNGNSLKVF